MEQFLEGLCGRRRAAMEFLFTHLPLSDLDCYDRSLFLEFSDHAIALRESAPWCAELDDEIFYHYVLFPRVNDEDLSFHREIFRAALWDRIAALPTAEERILAVNRWCHEIASYEMQDDRTASPLTVYRSGSGRCGEESAFLVSALRSIGIPARQVYSPRWAHCDDNHAWVEALCDGRWRFLGACEPEPILDRGWFNSPASRALLVHSRVFGPSDHPLHGRLIETDGCVTWYNQTSRYALTEAQRIRVERNGRGAAGARIAIQVLNESSFHTIAQLTADENGEAVIELGLGDFHIFASLGEFSAERDCRTGDVIALQLESIHNIGEYWHDVDYTAPSDAPINPSPLGDVLKARRAADLAEGRRLREQRIAAMCPAEHRASDLISAAHGNAAEILTFLQRSEDPRREQMLRALTNKDLRDATAEILESHLRALTPQGELQDDIYISFVLSPRIELEPLTAWREILPTFFSEEQRTIFHEDPTALWQTLSEQINTDIPHRYRNLVWTPIHALRAKRCDDRSLRILYVALLRALGVPARLRAEDSVPEFLHGGVWHTVRTEHRGTLRLFCDPPLIYRQNWTLSRRVQNGWELIYPSCTVWKDGKWESPLPEGEYRVITSVRMPNGNQFAAFRNLAVTAEETTELSLQLRSYALSDLLRHQQLPPLSAHSLTGDSIENIFHTDGRPTLLLWLEEGSEPTEHVLGELIADCNSWTALPVNIFFLLRGEDALHQRTLSSALEHLTTARVLLDDWAFDLETTARHLTCDPDRPPLAVVCAGDGSAVYGVSGYHVGSVDLLRRIIEYTANN